MNRVFTLHSILFITLFFHFNLNGQENIWVLGSVDIFDEHSVNEIVTNSDYSKSDILVYHGNALTGKKDVLSARIKSLRRDFKHVYIVPGVEEWSRLKSKKLKNLGDFLDDEFKGDVIVPENSCGEIEIKNINENLSILFIDSQWYFNNWNLDKDLNKDCQVSSRMEFWEALKGEIGKLKDKQVIIFSYHPSRRYDALSGNYGIKKHIFPFSDDVKGLYLPLPILGTIISDTRLYLNPNASSITPLYKSFTSQMKNIVDSHDQLAIISSASSLNTVEEYHNNFMINVNSLPVDIEVTNVNIDYCRRQASYLQLSIEKDIVNAQLIHASDASPIFNILSDLPLVSTDDKLYDPNELLKPKTRKIKLDEDRNAGLSNFLIGKLNSDLYDKELTAPVLDLAIEKGGLTPLRLGGGKQTQSLRLRDSTGQVYLARSLKKSPEKTLPDDLQYKLFEKYVDHYFMAGHPLSFYDYPHVRKCSSVITYYT